MFFPSSPTNKIIRHDKKEIYKILGLCRKTKKFRRTIKKYLKNFSTSIQTSLLFNEILLLIKKHTDTLIEQTRTKPQITPEYKVDKQMQTFSLNPPIILVEEGKCLLAVSSFEATNSVFNKTDENHSFSISTPNHWNSEVSKQLINELNKLLELRSQIGLELHVDQV